MFIKYLHLHHTLGKTTKGRHTDLETGLPGLQNKTSLINYPSHVFFSGFPLRRESTPSNNSAKVAQFCGKTMDLATISAISDLSAYMADTNAQIWLILDLFPHEWHLKPIWEYRNPCVDFFLLTRLWVISDLCHIWGKNRNWVTMQCKCSLNQTTDVSLNQGSPTRRSRDMHDISAVRLF